MSIGQRQFQNEKSRLYLFDSEEFGDLCDQCKKPMTQPPLLFRGLKYHATHFHCCQCLGKLDHRAKEFGGELYCSLDYAKLMSKSCNACRMPIVGLTITAMGKIYHPEHFVCFKCELPFNGSPHFENEGKIYCEVHYKEVTGALCKYCCRGIRGKGLIV